MISKGRGDIAPPSGYCLTTIGEVVEDRVSQDGPTKDFIYLDIGSVDRDSKTFFDLKTVALNEAPSRARQVVQPSDVLVSMTRPNLNAVAMATDLSGEVIASTGFHVLRSPWVEPKLLLYLVQTEGFIQAMTAVVQGALYPAVRPKDISSFQFGLPPRGEQSRIVEKLEEVLSDLDAGVAELKAAQRKLAQYRQSLLKAAIEGTLTADWRAANGEPQETGAVLLQRILSERRARWELNQQSKFAEQGKAPPKGWKTKYSEPMAPDPANLPPLPDGWAWVSLDQLLLQLRSGTAETSGRDVTPFPVLKSSAVRPGVIDFTALNYLTERQSRKENYLAPQDLLITRLSGSVEYVGCAAVVSRLPDGGVQYPDRVFCGKVAPGFECLGDYLAYCLRSPMARARIEVAAKSTAGHKRISLSDLQPFPIPLPPLAELRIVVDRLNTFLGQSDEAQTRTDRGLQQATAQRRQLLTAAFAGHLVPQDPRDEPASDLLSRIRAERAKQAEKPKVRKTKKPKEIAAMASRLLDVLAEAADWVPAQEAFRRCGVADGASTDQIETLYAELRTLDKTGRLEVEAMTDPQGRKMGDKLKLRTG